MTPLDKLTEAVAVTYASGVAGIVGRHPEHAVEVCRFHREGADEFLAAIQAALPEGHYLGREGVVRATRVTMARTTVGTAPLREALYLIEPAEADQ